MKEKKKILFVVHQLNYGGVQKAALSALNAIDYSIYDVTLYVRKNRIPLISQVNKNVKKIIVNEDRTHYYRKPYVIYCELGKILSNLLGYRKGSVFFQQKITEYINEAQMIYEKKKYFSNQEKYDVAISYIQGYTTKFVAEYIEAKKKIMFYHVSTDENHELHKATMPYYDRIVGVSEGVKNILEKLYPEVSDRMTFIENYVSSQEIEQKSKEYDIVKIEGKLILCTCGRLASVKGFDLAVEAAKVLKHNGVEFLWYFVGDGPERENITMLVKKNNLADNIKIMGMLDNPYPYIAGSDVYVQSSYEESYGLTIKEALLLKRIVVTTATLGGKYLINHNVNGIIAEIDGEEIGNAIMRLISNIELKNEIRQYVENIDYSNELIRYKEDWKALLEG